MRSIKRKLNKAYAQEGVRSIKRKLNKAYAQEGVRSRKLFKKDFSLFTTKINSSKNRHLGNNPESAYLCVTRVYRKKKKHQDFIDSLLLVEQQL